MCIKNVNLRYNQYII